MANSDSFIDEVTEEVRRDRLYRLLRKYGWIPAVLVVLLVGGTAWFQWQEAQKRAEAEALGDALLSALDQPDEAARTQALAAIETGDNPLAGALQALISAGVAGEAADVDALWAISEDAAIPAMWRDIAALKAAIAGAGETPATEVISRLEPLALPGAPYRLLALEQIALAELSRGETTAALDVLSEIAADDATGQGLRQRAEQLIVALGGAPDPA
ncbi:MAG: hypothetical protein AAGM21_09880 [Pseudomonadota bacterium]